MILRHILLCVAITAFAACGEDTESDTLTGSVSRIYPLSFDSVRARVTSTQFAIQYVKGGQVPVQVVIELMHHPIEGPATFDLAFGGTVVGSRDGNSLPDFIDGQLILKKVALSQGATISGEFNANVGTDSGNNYAVHGTFDTTLEVID